MTIIIIVKIIVITTAPSDVPVLGTLVAMGMMMRENIQIIKITIVNRPLNAGFLFSQ